jgi:NAD(P)-dependent dehydrogenase (short-subunit alcohol dehydrogenase family)
MRTSILTGATGFIGSALVLELLEHTDSDVVAIVRPGSISGEERTMGILRQVAAGFGDRDRALARAHKRLTVVEGDVRNLGAAKGRLAEILGVDPFASSDRRNAGDLPDELVPFLPESFDAEAFEAYDTPAPLCAHYWSGEIRAGLEELAELSADRALTGAPRE